MTFNFKNEEHYPDPTAFFAMSNIEEMLSAYRPIVYICSPYSGDVEANVEKARWYSRCAVLAGYIPIAPHLLFPQFMDDESYVERELGLRFAKILLRKSAEVWVCGETISSGMAAEIKQAKWKNIPVRYFTDNMHEMHYEKGGRK